MQSVTASKADILFASNVEEVKPDVEGDLSKVRHDENELFMPVEDRID